MHTRRGAYRPTLTMLFTALPLLVLAGCADQGPVEPGREETGEGFLSAEQQAAALEGPPVSASMEAEVTVTDGEVCHLVGFDDVCNDCSPQAPPGSGISFSDNWIAFEWPFAPSQPNMALFGPEKPGQVGTKHAQIHLNPPASRVDLLFTSLVDFTLEARDASGGLLASKSVAQNTTDGENFDPLGMDLGENLIARVTLKAGASFNTGIDDLEVCRRRLIKVEIDVKPGSDLNAVNPESRGTLPVAVLSTQTAAGESVDFDAADAEPSTITLGDGADPDAPVAERRNGTLMASLEDVDEDGDLDLVVHFETQALVDNGDLDDGTGELELNGETGDGTPIRGSDDVKVVESGSP